MAGLGAVPGLRLSRIGGVMSRVRRGVHEVQVRRVVQTDSPYGPERHVTDPVTVQCNVQPVNAEESQALGLSTATVYRLKYFPGEHGGAPWPGGPYSRITWRGREFEQRGDALESSMSPRTAHVKVLMVDVTAEVR